MKKMVFIFGIISHVLAIVLICSFAFVCYLAFVCHGSLPGVVRYLVNHLPEIITALAAVVAAITGIDTYQWQTKVEVFLKYTERYKEIMSDESLTDWRLNMDMPYGKVLYGLIDHKISHKKLQIALLNYLNLCSEEYSLFCLCSEKHSLFQNNKLNQWVWGMWEKDLTRTLRTPLLKKEWKNNLWQEFEKPFRDYVEKIQNGET